MYICGKIQITSFEILDRAINLKAFGEYTTVSVKLTRKFVRIVAPFLFNIPERKQKKQSQNTYEICPIKVENPHIHRYGINCFPLRKEYLL